MRTAAVLVLLYQLNQFIMETRSSTGVPHVIHLFTRTLPPQRLPARRVAVTYLLVHRSTVVVLSSHSFFLLFSHTFAFQILDTPWSQVSSLPLPGYCLQFLSRIRVGFIPLFVDFSSSVAILRSRAFRKSICIQKKVPANLSESYALGGARTHETDLYQARG